MITDVFRTQSNILDGAFCKNSWLQVFFGVSQGYEYASDKTKQNLGALSYFTTN